MNKKNFLGYAAGSFSESAVYAFINSFYLLFLTSIAGLNPSSASTIVSFCLVAESLSSLVFGRLSDASDNPAGKRRPFLLVSGILLPIALILSFTAFPLPPAFRFIYYLITGGMVRLIYSAYYIPYIALGAEITTDYDERTRQRTICKFFTGIGNILSYICPLLFIDYLIHTGLSSTVSWVLFTAFLALLAGAGFIGSWKFTAGCEKAPVPHSAKESKSLKNILKTYLELLKLRPMTSLVLWKVCFSISFTLCTGTQAFYLLYILHLPGSVSSQVYAVSVTVSFLSIPVIGALALKLGKKGCVQIIMGTSACTGMLLFLNGVNSYIMVILYVIAYTLAHSSFWQLTYPLFYDVCEADQYAYGKKREGDITSLQSVLGTIASAIIMQLMGVFLEFSGFSADQAVQPESALQALRLVYIAAPSLFLFAAAVILIWYPLSKKVHRRLVQHVQNCPGERLSDLDKFIFWKS